MDRPGWAPEGVDIDRPSAARQYDYLLGGSHNFAVDRETVRRGLAVIPDMAVHAQANRAFLYRAVRYLVGAGVRQFLDIGSGVPTVGNVHEVVQRADPQARVVYVDIDPVAVAHSRAILAGNEYATVIQQDLRDVEAILAHPEVRGTLAPDQPIALLMVALLHAISDQDDPYRIVARFRDALAPGSHLVVSHGTADSRPAETAEVVRLSAAAGYPITLRSRAGVERLFAGWELIEPGVVWVSQWRPEDPADAGDQPEASSIYAGMGRKP